MKTTFLAFIVLAVLLMTETASAVDLVADGPDTWTVVGSVDISDDGTDLTVTITITDTDWILVSTKVHVADDVVLIPQNNQNNPKVGQFGWTEPDVGATNIQHVYTIALTDIPEGPVGPDDDNLFVAVHAKVRDIVNLQTLTVVSGDGQTMVTRRRAGDVGAFTATAAAAVRAKEPINYPDDLLDGDDEGTDSLWDTTIDDTDGLALQATGADWIWESDEVVDPVVGTVITLQRDFEIDGYPMSGTLLITCDNGYEAFVGGTSVGSAQVSGAWLLSNLTETFVNTSGWQSVESFNVLSELQSGDNVLTIDAANEELPGSTISSNPGACIFALEIESAREETAWGDGEQFNEKKSWAMYIEYTLMPDLVVSNITLDSATIIDGDFLTFTYTVANIGGEGPIGNSVFDVAGYLSADAVLDGSDTMILGPGGSSGTYSVWTYHLAVGWSDSLSVSDGEITAGPGTYYLIMDADSTNAYPGVAESDENNNSLAVQFEVVAAP